MADSILTPIQERVLHGIFNAGAGDRGFFLTGGTALSEFYLKHRRSDDLDLFRRATEPIEPFRGLFEGTFEQIELACETEVVSNAMLRFFVFPEDQPAKRLKIEVCSDPTPQVAPTLNVANVCVDSFEDIAVNKVCTILGRSEPKDFVDLYFILRQSKWTLEALCEKARTKEGSLDTVKGKLDFAACLALVDSLPQLEDHLRVKPFDWDDLRAFLYSEAKRLLERFRPNR